MAFVLDQYGRLVGINFVEPLIQLPLVRGCWLGLEAEEQGGMKQCVIMGSRKRGWAAGVSSEEATGKWEQ